MSLNKLRLTGDIYRYTNIKSFSTMGKVEKDYLNDSYFFAKKMSYDSGKSGGHHRKTRTGGKDTRRNGQIFCDTFNGKVGEFAIYQFFLSHGIQLPVPDLTVMGEREWDDHDFIYKGINIGVKTTKKYGNLLLLETGDWNNKGQYKPNLDKGNADYDFMLFVRIDTQVKKSMTKRKIYFNEEIESKLLKEIVRESTFEFDIVGYSDKNMIIEAINEGNILYQEDFLQRDDNPMDADNYYIQSGDLFTIENLINFLKSL